MYKYFKLTCMILIIIGAINWGLVGVFDYDLVAAIFGEMTTLSRAIYALVGFSGLAMLFMFPRCYMKHKDDM